MNYINEITNILKKILKDKKIVITEETQLINDLCMISLHMMMFVVELEEIFKVDISPSDMVLWQTVGDIVECLKSKKN